MKYHKHEIKEETKMTYPVNKETCSKCPVCSLVTKDLIGAPIELSEMYFQCLAMCEDVCREGE